MEKLTSICNAQLTLFTPELYQNNDMNNIITMELRIQSGKLVYNYGNLLTKECFYLQSEILELQTGNWDFNFPLFIQPENNKVIIINSFWFFLIKNTFFSLTWQHIVLQYV